MRSDTADSFTANPTFAAVATGQLASRTGYADFLGYNGTYGSYIGGGGGNSTRYLYAGGYINNGSGTYTLWHSGNDGSGSGLDADTVDGIHASSFAQLSGATFTGDITVNGGDIILGGTGRIQGVDTVSSGTDAANKNYVDTAVASAGGGTAFSAF